MKPQHTSRGALRHWVIGCGIVIVLMAAAIGGLGYFGWTKIKQHMDFGFIDTVKMIDPPPTATPEDLFPPAAGVFKRVELTTVAAIPPYSLHQDETSHTETTSDTGSSSTTHETTVHMNSAVETSGPIVHARYLDLQENAVYAYALNPDQSAEIEKQHPDMLRSGRGGNKTGFHMTMKKGDHPFSMATWTKKNWTYYVQTTATEAMNFVSQFTPGASPTQ